MEFVLSFIIYFTLAPIVLGWLLITISPLIIFLLATVYLIQIASETEEVTDDSCILVVDDEFQSVLPLINLLEKAKIPFRYAKSGVEAINELSHRHFRLIFMDFYMPNLTGVETLNRADKVIDEQAPPTPVIFYSGKGDFAYSSLAFRHLSVVDRWSKSMNLQNLGLQLHRYLDLNPS
ncbi:MAG: hypothetical protein RJB66_1221 [Pseudomonadota bacterium]